MASSTLEPPRAGAADAAWREAFDRDGFAGPIPLFTPGQCALIARHFRNSLTHRQTAGAKTCATVDRFYHDAATRPAIRSLLRELLGPDVILWGATVIVRAPGEPHPWHTDIESSSPEGGFVSLWIGLEHTSRDAGLNFVTRSHRFGRPLQQVRHERGVARGATSDEEVLAWARAFDPAAALAVPDVRDGDAVVFDGRVWHGSKNTQAAGERLALLLQFASADRPVRRVAGRGFDWPFQFDETNLPPVIAVSGQANALDNRVADPPRRSTRRHAALGAEYAPIRLPLEFRNGAAWTPHPLFRGRTANVPLLHAHASVLAPGHCPHPPHLHLEEEILVVLDGAAEILVGKGEDCENAEPVAMRAGSFAYYPSYQSHTLRNVGKGPLHYLMFRWAGPPWESPDPLALTILHTAEAEAEAKLRRPSMSYAVQRLLQGPTGFLGRLHVHLTVMDPGGGYTAHVDRHDVAIVLLAGRLEADGRVLQSPDLTFIAAGVPHGLRNPGDEPARYLVFEFERPGGGPDPEPKPEGSSGRRRRRRRGLWARLLPRWAHGLARARRP